MVMGNRIPVEKLILQYRKIKWSAASPSPTIASFKELELIL
jgi:hypothetical protein